MRGKVGDEQRILHIKEAIKEIEGYTRDIDINEFKYWCPSIDADLIWQIVNIDIPELRDKLKR